LDGIVRAVLALIAAFILGSMIALGLATWVISRWARRRGRRGGRISALVAALGSEVFVIASLSVHGNADRIDATTAKWLLGSAVATAAATVRICQRQPTAKVPEVGI
jgi:branched-subunit amino acid ABC-type transport system permease component